MSQAGGIATLPERHVGLASGSLLTALIIAGNIAVVVNATVIAALGGPEMKDYAPGVEANYLIAAGLAVAGLLAIRLTDCSHLSWKRASRCSSGTGASTSPALPPGSTIPPPRPLAVISSDDVGCAGAAASFCNLAVYGG